MKMTTTMSDPAFRPHLDGRWRRRPLLPLLLLFWLCSSLAPQFAWGGDGPTAELTAGPESSDAPPANGNGKTNNKTKTKEREEDEDEDETLLERAIETIDERHEQISARVLASASWLDSFFASERIDAEAQETRLVVEFSLFAEDSRAVQFDLASRFRLSLPFMTERLQLVLSGDPDDELGTDTIPRQELRRRLREQRDQTVTVGLRYQLRHTLLSNISLRSGVRVRSGEPVLLLEPRYRQDVPLNSRWLLRFTQRFIAFSNDTYEVRTIFDLERPLPEISDRFFFRTTAEGNWLSDVAGYEHALHINLFQTLSPRRVLDYRISNFFQTRPNYRRESTVLVVLYRQRLGRDWLYGEVAPQLAFPRDRNFQPTLGIMLNLGLIFGAY
jgi:hypothetical protein